MKEFLYMIVGWIAEIHSYLMRFNDSYEYNFSDKELHFMQWTTRRNTLSGKENRSRLTNRTAFIF